MVIAGIFVVLLCVPMAGWHGYWWMRRRRHQRVLARIDELEKVLNIGQPEPTVSITQSLSTQQLEEGIRRMSLGLAPFPTAQTMPIGERHVLDPTYQTVSQRMATNAWAFRQMYHGASEEQHTD